MATCDIYRSTNAPPAAPDATGNGILVAMYQRGLEAEEGATSKKFTHAFYTGWTTDIRDAWSYDTVGGTADSVYFPDKTGTGFKVVYVEFFNPGTPSACKKVYLARLLPTWPTTEL